MEHTKDIDSLASKLGRFIRYRIADARLGLTGIFYRISSFHPSQWFQPPNTVAIIDDVAPNVLSAFRASEFSYLLREIKGSCLFSIINFKARNNTYIGDARISSLAGFKRYKKEFVRIFDVDRHNVLPFFPWTNVRSSLVYIVFLNNASYLLEHLEKHNIYFVLELYPGGGFELLTEGAGYRRLARVLASSHLIKVIATQKATYQFLVDNRLVAPEKVHFKYGGVLTLSMLALPPKSMTYPVGKQTIDICFTASKYMERGLDKGYDIFIDMAHILLKHSDAFRFHIAGGFDESDIAIEPSYRDKFTFYGFIKSADFSAYYSDKDIFVSPSRPFQLSAGAFDGFPTATCAEAGLNGLCMIFSDPLDQNVLFTDGMDAWFATNDAATFADIILYLKVNPEKIYESGANGKATLQKLDFHDQLAFRKGIIQNCINDQRNEAISS